MTAVVVDGQKGKEYRTPTDEEIRLAAEAEQGLDRVFAEVPFGLPDEPLPSTEALGIRVPLYGFDRWSKLFTPRQLLALGTFCKHIRNARQAMQASDYEREWAKGISAFLSCALARLADDSSTVCLWALNEFLCHTFTRFALPITWDFVEGNPLGNTSGNFWGAMDWVARFADHATKSARNAPIPDVRQQSATMALEEESIDLILTDPPYYDAIPYSDLMDFFTFGIDAASTAWTRGTEESLNRRCLLNGTTVRAMAS